MLLAIAVEDDRNSALLGFKLAVSWDQFEGQFEWPCQVVTIPSEETEKCYNGLSSHGDRQLAVPSIGAVGWRRSSVQLKYNLSDSGRQAHEIHPATCCDRGMCRRGAHCAPASEPI